MCAVFLTVRDNEINVFLSAPRTMLAAEYCLAAYRRFLNADAMFFFPLQDIPRPLAVDPAKSPDLVLRFLIYTR
jgi:hypothetical protein